MLLADAQRAAPGLPGEVHVEPGPGADHHVGLDGGQVLGDAPVREGVVLVEAGLGVREDLGGAQPFGVGGVGGVRAQIDEVTYAHARNVVEDRVLAVAEDGDDLHVVLLGEGVRKVVRRTDRPPDAVRVVQKERNMHASLYPLSSPGSSAYCMVRPTTTPRGWGA